VSEQVQYKTTLGNTLTLIETAITFILSLDYNRLNEKGYLANFKAAELIQKDLRGTYLPSIRASTRANALTHTFQQ